MADHAGVCALSFDCYGTLIDWQTGILSAVKPVLAGLGRRLRDGEIIAAFAAAEREAERPPYTSYKNVQRRVMAAMVGLPSRMVGGEGLGVGEALHGEPDAVDTLDALWCSIPNWPAFPETSVALRRLAARFRLAIVSNIDDDLFAHTQPKLGIVPDVVVTAQQVRSYKPGRAHFDELLRRLNLRPGQILHVAESRYHDIEPASAIGFPTAWVNRTGRSASASGPGSGGGEAGMVVRSLSELVAHIERAY